MNQAVAAREIAERQRDEWRQRLLYYEPFIMKAVNELARVYRALVSRTAERDATQAKLRIITTNLEATRSTLSGCVGHDILLDDVSSVLV